MPGGSARAGRSQPATNEEARAARAAGRGGGGSQSRAAGPPPGGEDMEQDREDSLPLPGACLCRTRVEGQV